MKLNQLKETFRWFEEAVREPSEENMIVQLGCHIEEFAEMLEAIGLAREAKDMHDLGDSFKKKEIDFSQLSINRKELLDAMCDQIVTATGVGRMFNLDIMSGMDEINRSNWSKFVDGKPVFNGNGKIKKGPNYVKPNLDGMY